MKCFLQGLKRCWPLSKSLKLIFGVAEYDIWSAIGAELNLNSFLCICKTLVQSLTRTKIHTQLTQILVLRLQNVESW